MSSLRAKLDRMKTSDARPEKRPRPGLMVIKYDEAADPALYDLDPVALGRMGLECASLDIEDVLFLDTETTGLSGGAGTVAFLTGAGFVKNGRFHVEQYMMRDYADEADMLNQVALKLNAFRYIVTFNGRTFDMPLLKGRFTLLRMLSAYREPHHLDLLFPSRRLWKRRLGNCRLSTLEDSILRRGREDDLPGSEVPQRFFDYLKTGDESLLEGVLKHNLLDILSLAALLSALSAAYASPEKQREVADLFSMGCAMQKLGEHEMAESCFEMAARPGSVLSIQALRDARLALDAQWALSLIYKRRGDDQKAVALWRKMAGREAFAYRANIELAKHYEHKLRDYDAACACAYAAQGLAEDSERALVERRIERLMKKKGES